MYAVHEDDVVARKLPGRDHKLVVGPDNLGAKNMCAGTAVFPAGAMAAPEHSHPGEEEIIYTLSGEGVIVIGDVSESLRPGVFVYIPATRKHRIVNTGNASLKVLYVFSPPAIPGSYDPR